MVNLPWWMCNIDTCAKVHMLIVHASCDNFYKLQGCNVWQLSSRNTCGNFYRLRGGILKKNNLVACIARGCIRLQEKHILRWFAREIPANPPAHPRETRTRPLTWRILLLVESVEHLPVPGVLILLLRALQEQPGKHGLAFEGTPPSRALRLRERSRGAIVSAGECKYAKCNGISKRNSINMDTSNFHVFTFTLPSVNLQFLFPLFLFIL